MLLVTPDHIAKSSGANNVVFFLDNLEWIKCKTYPKSIVVFSPTILSPIGIQRLYDEGDDGEEIDEGVGEEAMEEEEQDEEDEKEKDREGDSTQNKKRLLPERRSRRLKSEVK